MAANTNPNLPIESLPDGMEEPSIGMPQLGGDVMPGAGFELPSREGLGKSSDEMKSELMAKFKEVQNMNNSLNSKSMIGKNKLRSEKIRILKEVYDILKQMGVDPSNLESIQQFMQMLEENYPDFAQLLEDVFNRLDPNEELTGGINMPGGSNEINPIPPGQMPSFMGNPLAPTPPTPTEEGAGLMDKYKNLGAEEIMPRE